MKLAFGSISRTALSDGNKLHPLTVMAEIDRVQQTLRSELETRRFLLVPEGLEGFIDNPGLFGENMLQTFPHAKHDIIDAGNCVAADCGTAAVFHLMRIAEHGLRSVAKKLKVKLTNKGVNQPIEFADWNGIITGIRNQIIETRKLPMGKRKDTNLKFYSDVVDQCEYIKDIWRNSVSHTRKRYNAPDALGVLIRVREFMNTIATDMRKIK